MTQEYELIRVTKTGSESLKWAFAGSHHILTHHGFEGHGITLPMVPEYRRAIIPLRDPVDRFRSAYDMSYKNDYHDFRKTYPTIESLSSVIDEVMYDKRFGYTYLPQVWWTRGADYIEERGAIVVMTPDIDDFIRSMADEGGSRVLHWNVTKERSKVTKDVYEDIRRAYAADYRMFEMIGRDFVRTFEGDQDGQ